jgi:hypothetical protein
MGREEMLLEVLPPLDWDKVGTETWGDVVRSIRSYGTASFLRDRFSRNKEKKAHSWEAVFQPVRQPEWWKGDAAYHAPGYEEPFSRLEKELKSGKFVVTTEVAPPLSTATGKLKRDIEMVKDLVAAVNFTDSASASPRMSSMACSKVAAELGKDFLDMVRRHKYVVGKEVSTNIYERHICRLFDLR